MYKAFQDFYKEQSIKHLLLVEHNNELLSPPFATEKCKEYSKVFYKGSYIDLELLPATSKTNAVAQIDNSSWFIPYGIWDEFNTVVELRDTTPYYHTLPFKGKGQFYSVATDGKTAFSFPLGYEDTNFGLYIDGIIKAHELPTKGKKLHMGTVYCNGRYWSMPRGDEPGYNTLLSFDGNAYQSYELDVDANITRKYSDIIVKGNTLYSLPFGETSGLNTIVEFDTQTNTVTYHEINGVDFAKKYNCGVMLGDRIIALPYGDEFASDSRWGLVFDTVTKQSYQFDIGLEFGGKYRFRSGIEYNGNAYFFPSGTPGCPIFKIDSKGTILHYEQFENTMLGRPIIYNNQMYAIGHNMTTNKEAIYKFKEDLSYEMFCSLA